MYARISFNAFNNIYCHNIGTIHLMTFKALRKPFQNNKVMENTNV